MTEPVATVPAVAAAEENKDEPVAVPVVADEAKAKAAEAVADDADQPDDVDVDVEAAVGDKEKEKEEEEEDVYQDQLPNRVIVARNHPLSYYVDRARRILRMEDTVFVSGRGNTISVACTLVEVLKRQNIAKVEAMSTGMNVEPFFTSSGETRWSQPTSMITFRLVRGEFAEYVSDYHQRKVIEIFENVDAEQSGFLSFEQVEGLKFAQRFKATAEQTEQAKGYLEKQKEKQLDLPNFIKYSSILIHPLLRDQVFKNVLAAEFNIAAYENKQNQTQT